MIKLACNSCGAKLDLTDDIESFACGSCGSEWLVNRSGGVVFLKAVAESIKKIEKSSEGTEKHAEVLANQVRQQKIIERIHELAAIRDGINLTPMKKNPAYTEGFSAKLKRIVNVLFGLLVVQLLGLLWYYLNNKSFNVYLMLFACVIVVVVFLKLGKPLEYILDEEKRQRHISKYNEINSEIQDLVNKAKEIEESFLK